MMFHFSTCTEHVLNQEGQKTQLSTKPTGICEELSHSFVTLLCRPLHGMSVALKLWTCIQRMTRHSGSSLKRIAFAVFAKRLFAQAVERGCLARRRPMLPTHSSSWPSSSPFLAVSLGKRMTTQAWSQVSKQILTSSSSVGLVQQSRAGYAAVVRENHQQVEC